MTMKSIRLIPLLITGLLSACGNPGVEVGAGPTPRAVATATFAPTPTSTPSNTTTPTFAATAANPTAAGSTPEDIAIRPDLLGTLAFVRDGGIYTYQPQSGRVTKIIDDGRDMQFAPDGAQIAFVRDDGLYLAAADGSNQRRIVEQANVLGPQWSDDGTKIAFEHCLYPAYQERCDIWTIELRTGTARKIAHGFDPAWAPDSQRIAYAAAPVASTTLQTNHLGQLRLTSWLGEHDRAVVTTIPEKVPPIGLQSHTFMLNDSVHKPFAPVWDAAGAFIYLPNFVRNTMHIDFSLWERADADRGGSTFVAELHNAIDTTAAPNREVAVLTMNDVMDGSGGLIIQSLDPQIKHQQYAWAEYRELATSAFPAWAPDSNALAFFRCAFPPLEHCDLVVSQPGQSEPALLIPYAIPYDQEQFSRLEEDPGSMLAWGR
jgi:dipeptidyl aminopeptidase/acylaminoacyl peptidase